VPLRPTRNWSHCPTCVGVACDGDPQGRSHFVFHGTPESRLGYEFFDAPPVRFFPSPQPVFRGIQSPSERTSPEFLFSIRNKNHKNRPFGGYAGSSLRGTLFTMESFNLLEVKTMQEITTDQAVQAGISSPGASPQRRQLRVNGFDLSYVEQAQEPC
jgi:hypothetical protein